MTTGGAFLGAGVVNVTTIVPALPACAGMTVAPAGADSPGAGWMYRIVGVAYRVAVGRSVVSGVQGTTLPDWVVFTIAAFWAGPGMTVTTVIGVGAAASMTFAPAGAVWPGWSWT